MTGAAKPEIVANPPSLWVRRFAGLVPMAGPVLDLASGSGRHASLFLGLGHPVVAVDRDVSRLAGLSNQGELEVIQADLELAEAWPLGDRQFAGIVVVNYLHRPLLPRLIDVLAPGGVLIYETFAVGNEEFGRPRNPNFLLLPGELLDLVSAAADLQVVAYQHGRVKHPRRAMLQRICAVRDTGEAGASRGVELD